MPKGKTIIHSTLDPAHLKQGCRSQDRACRDAGLVLDAFWKRSATASTRTACVSRCRRDRRSHKEWLTKWMPKLTSNDAPLNPYRVLWDLQHTGRHQQPIVTHDAASPRDQLSPFWKPVEPLSISAGARPPSSL